MKNSIVTGAVASLFVLAFTVGASAQMGGGRTNTNSTTTTSTSSTATCSVSSVDATASTFDCATNPHTTLTFQVTTATVFQLGSAGTSFDKLAAGMNVTVQYHTSGSANIADSVTSS